MDAVAQVTAHSTSPPPKEASKHFSFCIILDHQYPFSSPQVTCETRFTNVIDLFDGRDIYSEVMSGEEWRVAKNLHEIMMALPEFVENTKQLEDQALEQQVIREAKDLLTKAENMPLESKVLMQVYGRYHLEHVYDLREF